MKKNISRPVLLAALGIAICADFIQMGAFAVATEGILSPLDDLLDVATCIILTLLLGWHFAFIPSFFLKLVPFLDEAPTWTLAVFIATRHYWTAKNVSNPDTAQKPEATVQDKEPPKILPKN